MKFSDVVRRSGRNLRQAKARTILTASAIAVGTFALTMTLAASNGAQQFVNKIITDNFDPAELIVVKDEGVFGRADTAKPREYDESFGLGFSNAGAATQFKQLTAEDIDKIKALPSTDLVREGVTLNLQYITREGQKKYVATADTFNPAQDPDVVAGQVTGDLSNKQLLLPEAYVSVLGFSDAQSAIGQTVLVAVSKPVDPAAVQAALQQGVDATTLETLNQDTTVEEAFTIAAVIKKQATAQPGTELYLFLDVDDARELNDITTKGTATYHKYSYAFVRVKDGQDETNLKAAQQTLKDLGYFSQSMKETQEFLNNIIMVLQGIVAAFGAIAVIASVFGIVNTMYISVLQRTREIGLMKALGMHKRDVGRLFRVEAAWIGFLGGVIGSLIAFGLGTALNPWITKKLELGDGNKLLIFDAKQVVILIVALMIVAVLAGFFPSRKAAKLDPIEALRTE